MLSYLLLLGFLAVPAASAHGALVLNEFDTYAISDFEGHEDSFPWEGWEIWDVYVGDGHGQEIDSHGVYFKVNLAGDGTLRPTGSSIWTIQFTWNVGEESFARHLRHDGSTVTSNFEELEWQIADGNVFQLRAWAPVAEWEGQSVSNLVLLSSVDGSARDIAPGGIFDPVTGTEIPFQAPPTPVFPAMGEGRMTETIPLTGAAKWMDVTVTPSGDGAFDLAVVNPLSAQGQHIELHYPDDSGWSLTGSLAPLILDGAGAGMFSLQLAPNAEGAIEPLRIDLVSDIGGLQTFYAYMGTDGVALTDDASMAASVPAAEAKDTPGFPVVGLLAGVAVAFAARRLN